MTVKKHNKKRKIPYTERSLQEQMETNLKKTKRLLHDREHSTAIIRAITTLDLFVTGLIRKGLQDKLSEKMTENIPQKI